MGYIGDFETKKDCIKHFLYNVNSSYIPEQKKNMEIFSFCTDQDFVLKEPNGKFTYYCLSYYKDENTNLYRFKYEAHTVGPILPHPIDQRALKLFLSNPSYSNREVAKKFIKEQTKIYLKKRKEEYE